MKKINYRKIRRKMRNETRKRQRNIPVVRLGPWYTRIERPSWETLHCYYDDLPF